MKESIFAEEQIVKILQESRASEKSQSELWKRKDAGRQTADVRQLRDRERETMQLKKLLAERDLEIDAVMVPCPQELSTGPLIWHSVPLANRPVQMYPPPVLARLPSLPDLTTPLERFLMQVQVGSAALIAMSRNPNDRLATPDLNVTLAIPRALSRKWVFDSNDTDHKSVF